MRQTPIAIVCLALVSTLGFAQDKQESSRDKYECRTLKSIIDAHKASVAELDSSSSENPTKMLLSGDSFPSNVTLVFLGKSRSLTGKRRQLLEAWKEMLKDSGPDDVVEAFGTELLFKEAGKKKWIAVRKPLLKPLPEQVKTGSPFSAYVIWMGAIKDDAGWDWLFAMNEFDPPGTQPLGLQCESVGEK